MKVSAIKCKKIFLCNLCRGNYSIVDQLSATLAAKGIHLTETTEEEEGMSNVLLLFNPLNVREDEILHIVSSNNNDGLTTTVISVGEMPPSPRLLWLLLENGATEVIELNRHPKVADSILARLERQSLIQSLLASDAVRNSIIGSSKAWLTVLKQVVEVAAFTQDSLLVLGESGTGKELVAHLVHELDRRQQKKDHILLDCSTIVPELSGSEFFGHEKGAFTNAIALREGAFCLADKGTLFLDEIGELPFHLQSELLRVIQEGTYKRVGSNHWKQTNFRLVCATNRDLLSEIQHNRFRGDLYYRISTNVVRLPSLRERRDDIPELAMFFLKKALGNGHTLPIDDALKNFLFARDYPGNVRELQQLVTRIAHRHVGPGPVSISDLPESDRPRLNEIIAPLASPDFSNSLRKAVNFGWCLKDIVNYVSDTVKDIAISCSNGDLQIAAQLLNVSDRTMQLYKANRKNGNEGTGMPGENRGEQMEDAQ